MNTSSSGRSLRSRKMIQPMPGYTRPNLWPEALIERTCSRRKSHSESRVQERPHERAAGPVDVQRDVEALVVLQPDEEVVDPGDVVGVAGERGAEHGGDADRVLVHVRLDVLGADRVLALLERHDPRLDVEVAAELLPHDVHVAAEHEVRPVGGLAVRLAALAPLPLERQRAQHDRLGGPLRARARGLAGRVEEVGQHPDAALLDLGRARILGVVDEVAVQALAR